jgi:CCR4-NOT transcription complex subunit 7/8
MDGTDDAVAGKAAWASRVQREEATAAASMVGDERLSRQPASSPPPGVGEVMDAATRALASTPAIPPLHPNSAAAAASSSFSLFPSFLPPNPLHHHDSHSIIALSTALPSNTAPSPLLSDEPSAPAQPNQLATDHILNNPSLITNVWAWNLQEELAKILLIIDEYPYIAMDTEFPGIVARPAGSHKTSNDYQYQTLRTNVDLLKIIQLGLCFCDSEGRIHPGTCTWQFNFAFSLTNDMYAQDSIDLLTKSGIDFAAHERDGIHASDFAEWLITSGIVLNEDVKWISFHSGFDFGYLLKILTAAPLPSKEDEFFALLQLWFPCVYDIKVLIDSFPSLHGGLSKIAETLNVIRIGPQHQAGSDSLLTAATYFKLKSQFFNPAKDSKWEETPESKNAVYRELKINHWAPNAGVSGGTNAVYGVITNTDPLNEFDTKFMGNLAGLNNDWTSEWKRKQESEREKRHRKEEAIRNGETVSSDEEELDFQGASDSGKVSSTASPNFMPASTSSQPSYLPMTPQKQSLYHDYSRQSNNTPSKLSSNGVGGMHRNRYSHDYS